MVKKKDSDIENPDEVIMSEDELVSETVSKSDTPVEEKVTKSKPKGKKSKAKLVNLVEDEDKNITALAGTVSDSEKKNPDKIYERIESDYKGNGVNVRRLAVKVIRKVLDNPTWDNWVARTTKKLNPKDVYK